MGKVIFYDVDGILYRHDCGITESTISAMKECEAKGHSAILCTGRAACMLPAQVEELPLRGRICQCGSYVSLDGKVLTNGGVSGQDCRRILEILHRYDCPFFIENSDYYYLDMEFLPEGLASRIDTMMARYPGKYRPVSELPDFIQKITGYPSDRSRCGEIREALSEWFDVIVHDEYEYIEITHKEYSKGTGVAQILNALGCTREDAVAFGDSANDISMLDAVGLGIVMGSAPEELKKRYRVTGSIYEDGIAKALGELFMT